LSIAIYVPAFTLHYTPTPTATGCCGRASALGPSLVCWRWSSSRTAGVRALSYRWLRRSGERCCAPWGSP